MGAEKGKKRKAETTEASNKRLKSTAQHVVKDRKECPYLSLINRTELNFDRENKCSQTLQTTNTYMCLVCGEIFHGRSKTTPAYVHALQNEHYVFADMLTGQIWCLPDMYEVLDDSLADIQHNLNLFYTKHQIEACLRTPITGHRLLSRTEFQVGYVGLNAIQQSNYINSVLQAMLHVDDMVRHYMLPFAYKKEASRSALRDSVGHLFKKVWNPHNYVGQVSPRLLLEQVEKESQGRFKGSEFGDPQRLMHFLLGALNEAERKASGKAKSRRSTVIEQCFQGRMVQTSTEYRVSGGMGGEGRAPLSTASSEHNFFTLPVPLPERPLSREESERNKVAQEHLQVLLQKYNGRQETLKGTSRDCIKGTKYIISKLPKYLVLFFERNIRLEDGVVKKNQSIVKTPVAALDLRDLCTDAEAARYSNAEYDLLSTVVYEGGEGGKTGYRTYQRCKQKNVWLELEDLLVMQSDAQRVSILPAYIQVWERRGTLVGDRNGPLYTKATNEAIASFLPPSERVQLRLLCSTLTGVMDSWSADVEMEVEADVD
eukprot:TRINITY_DN11687_c0_g1_i1.p2 TRINITY_DN11687_c0_g1~~TRINITY_DN11687_c0_g1_i1.p2  ORF type:complete len:564 (+),score=226.77 TRINITY_DN11687_c0_g1_i1:64-1692(+)